MFEGPTYSLADFAQNAVVHAERIERERTPEVLTVDGREALVVQDAGDYRAMVDRLEKAELLDAVRVALAQSDEGRGRPAQEAFDEMNAKYGF